MGKSGRKIAMYDIVFTLVTLAVILSLPVPRLVCGILCHELCMGLDRVETLTDLEALRFFYVHVGTWVVSMMVIVVSYIGLLVVYKKGALHGSRGEGHGISLKISTLPVILPFVINI